MPIIATIAIAVVAVCLAILGTVIVQRNMAHTRAKQIIADAEREGEDLKKSKVLEGREEAMQITGDAEKTANQRMAKVQQAEARQKQRELTLNQQQGENQRMRNEIDQERRRLDDGYAALEVKKNELDALTANARETLEHISGMSSEEAKEKLVESLKDEAKTAAAAYINDIMDEARINASKEAKRIIVQTIQRTATETAIENSVTVFHIDSDEIKGRIIGREGRNIRSIETLTGCDLIIDDTPEAITVSSFDPVRREVARIALEKLIADGRIHPARIEEMVAKAQKEVNATIKAEGERAVFETNIHGLNQELIKLLGRMRYRTSYGQNVLNHSIEVSHISGLIAAELGVDVTTAKRAGLLHDIGKAIDHEVEGSHVTIGVEICKKYKESEAVIHAIEAHHGDVEPHTVVACIVQAADAISASRPGARRENIENYVKRLEKLEEISKSFPGIAGSYAIQAGREIRVMVKPEEVPEDKMVLLARDIAKKIEEELTYPGQIKVHVLRETKAVEYAK